MADSIEQVPSSFGVNRGQLIRDRAGKLEAPNNIIQNVTAARTLYYKYRMESFKRIELYSKIEGLIAGNPPYNALDLQKAGLSHIANFNNMDGRSFFEKGSLAYWNLLNSTETFVKFFMADQSPESFGFSQILATNFDAVVREWPEFYTHTCTLSGQLVKFGVSPVIWSDERDWRWRTVELSRMYITDQAPTDTSLLTCFCVETSVTAQYLYEVYNEYKDKPKDASPWDMNELSSLLVYRANLFSKIDNRIIDMMDLQRRLQNGDIGWNVIFSDEIKLVTLLYKEYDGKISHYMFDRVYDNSNFLYFADRQYDSSSEVYNIFTASPAEFTINSNRGLGHKIFSGCQASMQLDCDIVNMARLSSTPFVKSIAGTKDFEPIRVIPGVVTNIGNSEFVQNQLGANIQQLVGASQYIVNKMQFNLANSGDDPSMPDKSTGSISGTQAKIESFKEFGVLKHYIAHFYTQFDTVVHNMVVKMLNSKKGYPGYEYAEEWKQRCITDGVPQEIFATRTPNYKGLPRQFRSVKASRVAGDGSTLARIMGLQELNPLVPSFGPKGIKNFQKEMVMATLGREYVSEFISPEEPDETAGGASLAGVENAVMQLGQSPIFSKDNEQRSHIVTHLALGAHIIQAIAQQQMTPVDADKVFTVLIPHMQQHIQTVAQDPYQKPFFESIKKSWDQVQQYAILNRRNAQAQLEKQLKDQQAQQEQQNQVMTKEQLATFQAQQDEQRKNQAQANKLARADQISQTKTELDKQKIVSNAENDRLKIELKHEANMTDINNKKVVKASDIVSQSPSEDLANMQGLSPAISDFK